jgi:ethanolamine-phosphate cytidylyltransferase
MSRFLREARTHGDWLVVGVLVLSDETVASYKRRPITTLAERVHGDDLLLEGTETVHGPAVADGRFAHVARVSAISTTSLIQRVLDAAASGE